MKPSDRAICAAAFETLCRQVQVRHPDADLDHLGRVYRIAERCHRGQYRLSTDPYILHSLTVASYVAQWGLPLSCVDAALLHDVPEAGGDLRRFPGDVSAEVISLVQAVTALHDGDPMLALSAAGVAMPGFVEYVLTLKIADRLHNARTWEFVPAGRRRQKARQTIDIVVPVAHRLGMKAVAVELNTLAQNSAVLSDSDDAVDRKAETASAADSATATTTTTTTRADSARTSPRLERSGRFSGFAMNRALRLLPPGDAERYAAEWSADLAVLETTRERIMFSLGLIYSAFRLRRLR